MPPAICDESTPRDRAGLEDLSQDVWAGMWRKLRGRPPIRDPGWARRSCVLEMRNYLRREQRRARFHEEFKRFCRDASEGPGSVDLEALPVEQSV